MRAGQWVKASAMSATDGARCALHFDSPSLATCRRCGRFCCQSCLRETEPPLCAECAPAMLDPLGLHARSFDLAAAFVIASRLVWAELPRLFVLVVLFALPAAALQTLLVGAGDDLKTVSSSIRVGNLYDVLVGLIGSQAMLALLIARAEGRSLSLGAALGEGAGNWGRALGARMRSVLWILLFAVLLVIPAIWKTTLLMFSTITVLRSQDRDALEASAAVVRGRFWLCFGFGLLVTGVCYVPMFLALTVVGVAFEALGVPRFPLEVVTDVIERLSVDVAMTSLLYVAYVMLRRTAGDPLEPMRWRTTPPLLNS